MKYLARMQKLDEHRLRTLAFEADMHMSLSLKGFAGLKYELRKHGVCNPKPLAGLSLFNARVP